MPHKLGLLYSVVSSVSLAFMGFFVSTITKEYSPAEALFVRSLITVFILIFIVKNELHSLSKDSKKWFFLRALCGGTAVLIYFYNLKALGPSLAIAIASFSTVFSFFIGLVINSEKSSPFQLIGIFLCNLGLALIVGKLRLVSLNQLLLGLFGALLTSFSYQFMKKASEAKVSANAVYFSYACASLIASLLLFSEDWKIPSFNSYYIFILLIISAWAGQIFLNKAYVTLGNAKASAIGRLILVWSFAIEGGFGLREVSIEQLAIYGLTIIGALMIAFGRESTAELYKHLQIKFFDIRKK